MSTTSVTSFNPEFQRATGRQETLERLTGQLGLIFQRVEAEDTGQGYLEEHSAGILLIDPLGRFAAIFSTPHDPGAMARDYITITNQPKAVR